MANKKPKKISKPLQLLILIASGIVVILVSIILKHIYHVSIVFCDLLIALGQALIIGPALSWILDLPSMIDYFKRITIDSLISKDYLQSLPRSQLVDLRKECTAKIHLNDADSVEKGLINMDENVCELLTKPYYERYRQNTSCIVENGFFVKKHYIEEYIINPLNTKMAFDDFPNTYLNIEDGSTVNDVFKIVALNIKVDDGEVVDYTPQVSLKVKKINKSDIHFNSEISWFDAQAKALSIDFVKSLHISRVMEIRTPVTDITFIKRVKMPVKSFKTDYSYSGDDLRLIGSCFGTMSYSNDGGMKIIQEDNYISIESFNWLLPGNGIFIVKVPK